MSINWWVLLAIVALGTLIGNVAFAVILNYAMQSGNVPGLN